MSKHSSIDVSDHDALSQLARDDPVAFENLRNEQIADFIDHAPEDLQRRLRGLQFRVDCIRHLTRSPLAALLKIQVLMWSSFLGMDEKLQKLLQRTQGSQAPGENTSRFEVDTSPGGQVIELHSYVPDRREYNW